METKMWSKEDIKDLLSRSDKAVKRGIIVIYNCQTEDEKDIQHTKVVNKIGFSSFDSEILMQFAELILRHKELTVKQMAVARKRIQKYAGQLADIANS